MRLTKSTRRKIREALMDFAFDGHDKAENEQKLAFFDQIVDFFLPENFLETTRELPDAWFPHIYRVSFVLPNGQLHEINVYMNEDDETHWRKVPHFVAKRANRYRTEDPLVLLGSPLADAFEEWMQKRERQKELRNQMWQQIQSVLDSCNNDAQVYQAFPQSEAIIQAALNTLPPTPVQAIVPLGRVLMDRLETIRDKKPAGEYA